MCGESGVLNKTWQMGLFTM